MTIMHATDAVVRVYLLSTNPAGSVTSGVRCWGWCGNVVDLQSGVGYAE